MRAFCFLVHGSHAFDAANALRSAFAEHGAKHLGYFRCHGEANFLGHLREGYLFSPDHPTPDELDRATAFGVAVGQRAARKEDVPITYEPVPPPVYRIERAATSRWLVEQIYSRLFTVDPSRCTACGLCMETYPTKNIEKNEQGHPTWGRRCLYCLSCEMKCPEDAIKSAISRPVIRTLVRSFLRYNVSHWARDPDLDYVRVVHRHGRTERLENKSAGSAQI